MKYRMLSPQYKLRGWIGFPYALVHNGDVLRLSREEFSLLLLCDGQTDLEAILNQETLKTLHSFEEKGFICCADSPKAIEQDQYYYHYDNRYIHDVYWSITGRCNFRCRHCYLNAPDAMMGEISHDEAIRVIDQMADCGVCHLLLSGGEPFVRQDFWSLVDYALEKEIQIDQIYTNGWMLTDNMLDKFEQRGMKPEFSISFDGLNWHDWMRGIKGAEQAALKALERCFIRGFPTTVEMCIHRGNVKTLRDTVKVLADTGTKGIKFSEVSETDLWKKNADGNEMNFKEYVEAMLGYIPAYFEDGMPVNILAGGIVELYKGSTKYKPVAEFCDGSAICLDQYICESVRNSCYIAPDGRLLPCMPIASSPDQSMFPKVQDIGLQTALKESVYIEFAKRKVKDLLEVCKTCRECPYHLYCGGGCRATALMGGEHNLMGPDPYRCMMWKEGYLNKVHEVCDEAIHRYCRNNESA